jgi:TnpA family transposase
MPRSIQEILDHADELAERFETYEPEAGDERSLEEDQLERAALVRARSERQVADAVICSQQGLALAADRRHPGNVGPSCQQRYGGRHGAQATW